MSEGDAKIEAPLPTLLSGGSIYSKPSLPYLLTEYGFEDKEAEALRKKKEERKQQQKLLKKQAKKSQSFDSDDDEKDLEREREREQHYEQMIKDLHRLRDYYYREYSGMLADKVDRQRKEQKDRDAVLRKKKEKEEEDAKKASHRVKKRLERHTLASTPITEDVPKTDLYHIIGLENKLKREGKLKTVSDYNKFREAISQPHIFNHFFNKPKFTEPAKSITSTDYASSHREPSEVFSLAPDPPEIDSLLTGTSSRPPRSLSRISEAKESSRPGTRTENWAITQQYPAIHKGRKSLGQIGKQKSEYKQDLEKRFPKLEMPKLHCFTMNLAKKPPDPEEVHQQMELRAKEKQRKRAVRTYSKMYQLAMSNAAASNRIFDLHEDMDMLIYGPDLCDVIADNHWMEAYGLREEDMMPDEESGETTPVATPYQSALPPQAIEQGGASDSVEHSLRDQPSGSEQQSTIEELKGDRSRSSGQRSRKSSGKSKKSASSEKAKSPLPLTIDEIQGECSIMEAKTLSSLWNNYLRAGKSRES